MLSAETLYGFAAAGAGGAVLWALDKSFGFLAERETEKIFFPEKDRRSFTERLCMKFDALESEHSKLVELTERVIRERDEYMAKYHALKLDLRSWDGHSCHGNGSPEYRHRAAARGGVEDIL